MELEQFMKRAEELDEVLERFILNLPENYDDNLYQAIINEIEELEKDVSNSSLDDGSKLIVIGTLSALMEYAGALIETF